MSTKIIQILQEGRKSLQEQLATVDTTITNVEATIQHGNPNDNPSIQILLKGRESLHAQLEQIERTISNITEIVAGKTPAHATALTDNDAKNRPPAPGQYSGMKLSTAVQAYLAERGRGPVLLAKLVEDLKTAGILVGKHRELPDTRDLRLLAANNRKRFSYDSVTDTISLRTAPGNDTGRTTVKGKKLGLPVAQMA